MGWKNLLRLNSQNTLGALEVVGQMIDKLTTTNKELLNLHKTKKDIQTEKGGPTNVTNGPFVGGGGQQELQKMLKGKKDGETYLGNPNLKSVGQSCSKSGQKNQ